MKKNDTYRERFNTLESVLAYEEGQYASGTYGNILWCIEQDCLRSFIDEFRCNHRSVKYLDFASGTGRILSFMENIVDDALGIEISTTMTAVALRKVKKAKIFCYDITAPYASIEGKYDFITAYRFILNAETKLREAALKALAARMRDKSSYLVFNNHGYLWSYRTLAWPYHLVGRFGKKGVKPNYLSHRDVYCLADKAGLRIDRIVGCGVFSNKVARLLSFDKALRLEKYASRSSVLSRFGVNQIYIARLK
jgi:hypothetical protein